jgi:hypothetical protein
MNCEVKRLWKKKSWPKLRFYWVFSAQADWTSAHTSHKNTDQSTIEASITLDGVIDRLTDKVIIE